MIGEKKRDEDNIMDICKVMYRHLKIPNFYYYTHKIFGYVTRTTMLLSHIDTIENNELFYQCMSK